MRYSSTQNNGGQYKSKSKERRRRYIDDELGSFAANQDLLLKKTHRKYKIAKKEADRQIRDWEKAYS